jgi:hypothetical protein
MPRRILRTVQWLIVSALIAIAVIYLFPGWFPVRPAY